MEYQSTILILTDVFTVKFTEFAKRNWRKYWKNVGYSFLFWKNRFWIIIGSVNYCVDQELCPDGVVTCLHF